MLWWHAKQLITTYSIFNKLLSFGFDALGCGFVQGSSQRTLIGFVLVGSVAAPCSNASSTFRLLVVQTFSSYSSLACCGGMQSIQFPPYGFG
jgi:hypothetical protein